MFSAFEKVGVKVVWVTGPFFIDMPFGERLCEWPE